MEKKLSLSSYVLVGSLLFGLFFGAGNLIFPVHMGQEAGSSVFIATLGFLITAIGLPFLGVVAIGVSQSSGLFELSSRVHAIYGYGMTLLLYLTIGPFFALPRTCTVSYEIGFSPVIPESYRTLGLLIFTLLFFLAALFFSLRPSHILDWVGKILNPLFLLFLAFLVIASFVHPMGIASGAEVQSSYTTTPFFKGFLEGYNTMDALASLAFGIIVVQALKNLGVTSSRGLALGTIKAGAVSIVLMGCIYACLAYIGSTSLAQFSLSSNGGIALSQVAKYYFGSWGSLLLALIVTFACLKTAIGLITACAETFKTIFPKLLGYKGYVIIFTVVSALIANVGLTEIISLSIPVLMFLYPLAISLIILGLLSPLFHNRQCVYVLTTGCVFLVSIGAFLQALPATFGQIPIVQGALSFFHTYVPFFSLGMGWVVPLLVGLSVGWLISLVTKPKKK
ncbi:branched-chain amino acid transport system II carrier protein [uncultured Sphaerochaeta sp.]|uniref:branched-chain amino acid transport system II carrier protein n=1 Tax=uncultured Sphaerochaeta sp. TaxID=886478 RepID=UPI002A0A86C8|nr:branched-chain amino acid transport system II carrier protein [uncultured Sphaerochaeta sp.]